MRRLPADHPVEERPTLTAVSALNDGWHNQLCKDDPQPQRDDHEDQQQADNAHRHHEILPLVHWSLRPLRTACRPSRQTTSTNVRSMCLKKTSPPISKNATTTALTAMTPNSGPCLPSSAQRNPSMTPAIGFRLYKHFQFSGTRLTVYASREASIQQGVNN